jgi:hypothetical protein
MIPRGQVIRFDPADWLDAKEHVERLRQINPELVDAMLDPGAYHKTTGRLNVQELRRLTGRPKNAIYRDVERLRGEA